MRVGLCTISNKDWSVESVLSAAAETGYDGVEVWGRDHLDGDGDTCRRVRDAADELGLEIPVYGSYLRAGIADFERDVETELRVAERLDASLIRVWAGTQEWQERDPDHLERVVDDLRTVARRASDRGVEVTVEKHQGTLTNRRAGARELIDAVDHANCGLNWQPLFSYAADELVAEARDLAPYANNVHLQAVDARGGDRQCLLEEAYFDVESVLAPFRDGAFDGYVEVEFVDEDLPYEEAIRRDAAHLRTILE